MTDYERGVGQASAIYKEVIREYVAENTKLREENAKLRDAIFSNAKKHALHHMDEDELRIWATQQAEYIEKLKKLVLDAWGNGHPDKSCGDCEILDECHEHMKNSPPFERCLFEVRIEERMRELGVTDD